MKKKTRTIPQLEPGSSLVDTHCHLDMESYADNLDEVILSAAEKGVDRIITVGIDRVSSEAAVAIAARYPGILATVGVHPHNAAKTIVADLDFLAQLAQNPANRVVGYGEIGLDYAKKYAPPEQQQKSFADQLDLARSLKLPVIIHDRDAHIDTMRLLSQFAPFADSGVMHCFSGDMELARQVLDLGFFISIPGIVTFPKSEMLQTVAREVPLDSIILETDGPFLAPVPFRGKTNRPEYVLCTAQKIAELRGISLEEVARQTTRNAELLFRLNTIRGTA